MRIVYLHQYFLTPSMSGGTRSYEMARRLVSAGHQVTMITTDRRPGRPALKWTRTNEAGIDVLWLNLPYDNRMSNLRRMIAFVAFSLLSTWRAVRTPADLVFASSTPLTIAIPGVVASRIKGVPMVFEVRDLWPEVPIALGALRNPILKWIARGLETFAYRNANAIVALAPGMAESVVKHGYPRERIAIIPNGCDIELFDQSRAGVPGIRSENAWLGHRPLVLYAGTIGRVNCVDYFVRLAYETARIWDEPRFVIIGEGIERDAVKSLAAERGVLNENLFLIPSMPKSQVAAWVCAADVCMSLCCDFEYLWKNAVGNKFFDALAAGRPILSNHPGFQSEVAAQAGAGLVLDSADTQAAAILLVKCLSDAKWLEGASRASLGLATSRFDRNLLGAQLLAVLEAVARGDALPESVST